MLLVSMAIIKLWLRRLPLWLLQQVKAKAARASHHQATLNVKEIIVIQGLALIVAIKAVKTFINLLAKTVMMAILTLKITVLTTMATMM